MALQKKTNVRRDGSSLIATFPNANPPLIWRFDLERNHSFTVAMQGQDNEWELGVTSVKGEFHPVARFPMREDAEEAFETVSVSLAEGKGGWVSSGLKFVGMCVLLFVLSAGVAILVQEVAGQNSPVEQPVTATAKASVEQPSAQDTATPPTPPPTAPAEAPKGVPLSADDVLKPPSP